MKVQAHSSLESPLEYNQDQGAFDESRFVMTFLTILGVRGHPYMTSTKNDQFFDPLPPPLARMNNRPIV